MLDFNDLKMLLREQEEERNQNATELEQIKLERAKLQKELDKLKANQIRTKTATQTATDNAKAELLKVKAEILKATHEQKQTEIKKAKRREQTTYILTAIINAVTILSTLIFFLIIVLKC